MKPFIIWLSFLTNLTLGAYIISERSSPAVIPPPFTPQKTETPSNIYKKEIPLPQYIDEQTSSTHSRNLRILFIGNSLTYAAKDSTMGWDHAGGMAASEKNKDFVHLLVQRLATEHQLGIKYRIKNLSSLEQAPGQFSTANLGYLREFKPDIIVFQLGENVSNADSLKIFKTQYQNLIQALPAKYKIITTPFWVSHLKNKAIAEVATQTQSLLVDLSHLSTETTLNFAGSEKPYTIEAVANHPGDTGMQKIADHIYIPIHFLLTNHLIPNL